MSTQARLAQAGALHQAGRLAEAAAQYGLILASAPSDPAALQGLGVVHHQQGNSAEAVRLLTRAAQAAPGHPEISFNLGLALFRAGRFAESAASFETALRARANWPEAHYNLGNIHRELGDPAAAMRAFRQALRLRPVYTQAEVNLANLLKDDGKREQAIAIYRRVLAREPNLPDTQNNLGTALVDGGDRAGAEAAFRAALALRPEFPAALANLASLKLSQNGALEAGRALYRRAEALLRARFDSGEQGLETRLLLAESLAGQRAYADAVALMRETAALFPQAWRPGVDLAETLRAWGRFEEAEAALPAQVPTAGQVRALMTRGALMNDFGRLDEAEAAFRAAMKLAPQQALPRYNLSLVLLSAGRYAEGFTAFESRGAQVPAYLKPERAWRGGNARGRPILVLAEEGLGDTIQFARWLPRLAALGADITLRAQSPLLRLMAALKCAPRVAPDTDKTPPPGDWVLIMSLPRLLGMGDMAQFGAPYLDADPALITGWRNWLPAEGLKVGLAWAGNPDYGVDHLRSCAPQVLAPLMGVPGVRFVSLQPGAAPDAIPGGDLLVPGERITDMADTAALIAALDLVITVDTAVAHLAGALGKPVWLLNRFNACWRWQMGTTSSVWYDSLRQYRQAVPGDWSGPVAAIRADLAALAGA